MPGSAKLPGGVPGSSISADLGYRAARWLLPLLAALFFVSGTSALVYQIIWLRLLTLVYGVTVHAASAVLASFMAGLAFGSYVGGRVADRTRRPLLLFGLAELLIGLSALLTPVVLDPVKRLYVSLHPIFEDAPPLLTVARLAFTLMLLFVPTSLMGATMPLVVRSSLARAERLGSHVSLLYTTNTAGAIAGVVLAGFYLIPNLGLTRSFLVAALLNGVVAAAAAVASVALRPLLAAVATPPVAAGRPAKVVTAALPLSDRTRRLVLLVFGLSGFASLALEVVWFRVLVIFLGPTAYAFSIMLATVLAGISLGSALVTPWMRRRIDWLAVLIVLQMGIAVAALLSFRALGFVTPAATYVDAWAQAQSGLEYVGVVLIGSVLAIIPTAVLLGVAFPIGARLWAGEDPEGGNRAGRVGVFYAFNICGAILGPVAAGFWLLPVLGSRGSLIAIAAMMLASAFLLLSAIASRRPRFAAATAVAGALAFGIAAGQVAHPLDVAMERVYASEQLLWRDEGVQTTVKVTVGPGPDRTPMRTLYLDGWHQANDSQATQYFDRLIGVLPMALHPDPKQALVIGLGAGTTPGAIAQFPGVHVELVELAPSVVRAADEWFAHSNFGLLRRPNVSVRIDDGRNHLLLTNKRYDVVTADIIVPRHRGSGNLYSAEYFSSVRQVLTPNGVMLQWLGTDTDIEFRTIMRTFLSVFPHATLWGGSLLVGTPEPLRISRGDFERRAADPQTRAALALAGISDFDMLTLLYNAGPGELRAYVGDGPILTDDRPLMEYFLSSGDDARPVDTTGLKGDVLRHVK